jgi:pilus assembly protein CpaB
MSNKRNSLVFLAVALVLGIAAAMFAQRWARQSMAAAEAQANRDVAEVVVAAQELAFGKRIEASQLRTVRWPADAVPDGAFHQVDKLVGMVSKYQILPGEPVLAQRIADPATSPLMASLIAPNKRAVTVRVDDVVGVGGFLLPGSRVDVVASKQIDFQKFETKTVLHNLRVLAVDQTASAGAEDKPVVVRAVTLETDPGEAEILVQATNEGSVQLALRNPEDESVPEVALAPQRAPRPVARVARVAKEPTMTVIRGTRVDGVDDPRK